MLKITQHVLPCRVLLRIKKKKEQMVKAELQAKVGCHSVVASAVGCACCADLHALWFWQSAQLLTRLAAAA
jgi:hypothetical protein